MEWSDVLNLKWNAERFEQRIKAKMVLNVS